MNWLYLIPVAAIVGVFLFEPMQTLGGIIIVAVGCVGAIWLTDKISGKR